MPVSGAIFSIVLLVLFQMHLILGEESFLDGKQGEAYKAYCPLVPRLMPVLEPADCSFRGAATMGAGCADGDLYVGHDGIVRGAGMAVRRRSC